MSEARPQTSAANAPLWGARARDWADVQEATARPAFERVIAETVRPGVRLLDIGCGSGMAAGLAADAGAIVAGIDAAEALLAIARARTPKGDFRAADLEALPFGDAAFDIVTSFNAVQYAGNPVIALREARRVVAPDGRVVVMVWGEPEGMEMAAVIKALGPLLPPPPPGAGGPFALSSKAALRDLAEAAGLDVVETIDVVAPIPYPDTETALRGLNSSGVAARAMGIAGEPAVTAAHAAAIEPFRQSDGSYRIGATFRCLFARPH